MRSTRPRPPRNHRHLPPDRQYASLSPRGGPLTVGLRYVRHPTTSQAPRSGPARCAPTRPPIAGAPLPAARELPGRPWLSMWSAPISAASGRSRQDARNARHHHRRHGEEQETNCPGARSGIFRQRSPTTSESWPPCSTNARCTPRLPRRTPPRHPTHHPQLESESAPTDATRGQGLSLELRLCNSATRPSHKARLRPAWPPK